MVAHDIVGIRKGRVLELVLLGQGNTLVTRRQHAKPWIALSATANNETT